MALLDITESWVGVQRRLDGDLRHPTWYPAAYVRIDLEGNVTNVSPSNARVLAKALVAAANLIDPPTPRKRKGA